MEQQKVKEDTCKSHRGSDPPETQAVHNLGIQRKTRGFEVPRREVCVSGTEDDAALPLPASSPSSLLQRGDHGGCGTQTNVHITVAERLGSNGGTRRKWENYTPL